MAVEERVGIVPDVILLDNLLSTPRHQLEHSIK